MDKQLINAYLRTRYEPVDHKFNLVPGRLNPALDNYLSTHNLGSASVITAWNPQSVVLADEQNMLRNKRMKEELYDGKYCFEDALGVSEGEDWVAEESFLVYDISIKACIDFCGKWSQNAFIHHVRGLSTWLIGIR